jgi:hypothetical protein
LKKLSFSFLSFSIQTALVAGITFSLAFLLIAFTQRSPSMAEVPQLFIESFGIFAVIGFFVAVVGFWVIYFLKARFKKHFKLFSAIVGISLVLLVVLSWSYPSGIEFEYLAIIFPLLPLFMTAIFFMRRSEALIKPL